METGEISHSPDSHQAPLRITELQHLTSKISDVDHLQEPTEDVCRRFAENTTLHGIRSIYDSTRCCKLFWIGTFVFILISFAICPITSSIMVFLQRPRAFEAGLKWDAFLPFPAITICNYNRFHLERLNKAAETYDIDRILLWQYLIVGIQVEPKWDEDATDLQDDFANITAILSSRNTSFLGLVHQLGLRWEEIFVEPSTLDCWDSRMCELVGDPTNYRTVITPSGLCYMFNANQSILATERSKAAWFYMSINQDQYSEIAQPLIGYNIAAGLRIIFHLSSDVIDTVKGIPLSSGFEHNLDLKKSQYSIERQSEEECGSMELTYSDVYSWDACIWDGAMIHILGTCGCLPASLIHQRTYHGHRDAVPICPPEKMLTCVGQMIRAFGNTTKTAHPCPIPCEVTNYKIKDYSVFLPNLAIRRYLSKERGLDRKFTRDNLLIAAVRYQDIVTSYHKVRPMTQTRDLIANIGSQLSLAVGASFLTLAEVLVFGASKLVGVVQRAKRKPVTPSS